MRAVSSNPTGALFCYLCLSAVLERHVLFVPPGLCGKNCFFTAMTRDCLQGYLVLRSRRKIAWFCSVRVQSPVFGSSHPCARPVDPHWYKRVIPISFPAPCPLLPSSSPLCPVGNSGTKAGPLSAARWPPHLSYYSRWTGRFYGRDEGHL